MKRVCNIIEQCMDKLPPGEFRAPKLPKTLKLEGEIYVRTENPLGADGLLRGRRRQEGPVPPEDAHGVVLERQRDPGDAARARCVPDLIAILGSIFFVVGDVDR